MFIPRSCQFCSKEFFVPPYKIRIGKGKFCSRKCYLQHFKPMLNRFWEKVDKSDGLDGCWLWMGSKVPDGYGNFRINSASNMVKAHRVAYELVCGPIPVGIHVLHDCPGGDNPSCVNPKHLWLGTHAQNMKDASKKKRFSSSHRRRKGSLNSNAKLTEAQVILIRSMKSIETQKHIAKSFNVSQPLIGMIHRRKIWTHI